MGGRMRSRHGLRMRSIAIAVAVGAAFTLACPWRAVAQNRPAAASPPQNQAPAKPELPPPPYEVSLLRLSELLGALSYLQPLCREAQGEAWRRTMQELLDAEARSPGQRARLAGAFNAGFRGYELTYRTCTENARLVIVRYLAEGEKIARDVANRFGGG